jgi:hypothetical protein
MVILGIILIVASQILYREYGLKTTGMEAKSVARAVGYCPYCGTAREEGAIYCEKCGKRLP